MTRVVTDTSPLRYLVLIEAIEILPRLYQRVLIPAAVIKELTHPHAPIPVRHWAADLPAWAEIKTARPVAYQLGLGPGETEAIALAAETSADLLLLDEVAGRREALKRGLAISGTLGVIEEAAKRHLVDGPGLLRKLLQTNFRIDPASAKEILR